MHTQQYIDDWDERKCHRNDPAHMLSLVKDVFALVQGKGKFKMTQKKVRWETLTGRRFDLVNQQLPPWRASNEQLRILRAVFGELRFLKLEGRGYECPLTEVGRSITLTMGQLAMLTGDVGVYMMMYMDIEDDQKMTMMRLLYVLNFTTLKEHAPDDLEDIHLYVAETLALAEIFFPIGWNDMVKHYLIHLFEKDGTIALWGPCSVISMFQSERFQMSLKRLIKSRKNISYSIFKKWLDRFISSTIKANRYLYTF